MHVSLTSVSSRALGFFFFCPNLSFVRISLLAFFTSGVSHGGGFTLAEIWVISVAELKAPVVEVESISVALSSSSTELISLKAAEFPEMRFSRSAS